MDSQFMLNGLGGTCSREDFSKNPSHALIIFFPGSRSPFHSGLKFGRLMCTLHLKITESDNLYRI